MPLNLLSFKVVSATPINPSAEPTTTPAHFLADLYTFNWSELHLAVPLVGAAAVALCLVTGLLVGHPGAALIAGGGALTIGFGTNQRISDSRVLPMLLAIFAMASAAFIGTLAGHRGWEILVVSAVAAALYGVLTIRNSGLAWVGQQAAVALFVASAFPAGLNGAWNRAWLTAVGGVVQILFTSVALRLVPDLRRDLLAIPLRLYSSLYERRRELLHRLHELPKALPAPDRKAAAIYAARLVVTITLASELYRRLGIQSGYWVPMTALLVQKPAFFETLSRGLARVSGTLAGAYLSTLLAAHLHMAQPQLNWVFAALTTVFAFGCFVLIPVNYALYTVSITSYIVFLLSLNKVPGPEIAHRRAFCTIAGAAIALVIHLDALRRHKTAATAP